MLKYSIEFKLIEDFHTFLSQKQKKITVNSIIQRTASKQV